jgi:hypothetical protein
MICIIKTPKMISSPLGLALLTGNGKLATRAGHFPAFESH